jgi:predicted adenine nucleotide alpha hydrolase (AANH) superfamily ATPase
MKTAEFAKEKGFDYFTTTLSVSPYKNAQALNEIGSELEKEYGTNYLYSDFKKKEGYKRSCELSREYNLYRQNYCGCIYSKQIAENLHKGEN